MSCTPVRHRIPCEVPELASSILTATIRDASEVVIPVNDLDALTATIYDEKSGTILNERDHESILGTNGGSVDAAGVLTFELDPEDNAIVDDSRATELHIVLLEWEYTVGVTVHSGKAEIAVLVRNLQMVPVEEP
jgi:hypothetical protein